MEKEKVRFNPEIDKGLTDEQVSQRFAQGYYNKASDFETKSVWRILQDNVCTLFNAMNALLALCVWLS